MQAQHSPHYSDETQGPVAAHPEPGKDLEYTSTKTAKFNFEGKIL